MTLKFNLYYMGILGLYLVKTIPELSLSYLEAIFQCHIERRAEGGIRCGGGGEAEPPAATSDTANIH